MSNGPIPVELPAEGVELLSSGSALRERSLRRRAASWRAIEARAAPRATRWVAAGFGVALACAVLVVLLQRAQANHSAPSVDPTAEWRVIEVASVGRMSLAPGTRARLPVALPVPGEAYRVTLDEGQLCAQVVHRDPIQQGSFVVEADGLRVTSIGTRFCVFAGGGPSWVAVEEGRVRVEASGTEAASVGEGESLRADDPRLLVAALASPRAVPATIPQTADPPHTAGTGGVRSDLADQNRLYQRGLSLVRAHRSIEALAAWDQYRRRYPGGVFGAEVDLRRVLTLAEEKRFAEALTAASTFQGEHPGDWRADEIALTKAGLLREQFDRPAEALALYDRLAAAEQPPMLRERALYGSYLSLVALARTGEARARARQYLELFPGGGHHDELNRALAGESSP